MSTQSITEIKAGSLWDPLLERLEPSRGKWPSRYAQIVFLLLSFNYFPVVFYHIGWVFFALPPEQLRCDSGGEWFTQDQCSAENATSCGANDTWEFESSKPTQWRLVGEWILACDRQYLEQLAMTLYFVGVMLGGFVFGQLSDYFGRQRMLIVCIGSEAVIGIIVYFIHNLTAFIVLKFFQGMFLQGLQSITVVMIMENLTAKSRTFCGVIAAAFWPLGILVAAVFGYFIQDWRTLHLVLSCLSLCGLLQFLFVDESLRWLLAHCHFDRAQKVSRKIAKTNGVQVCENLEKLIVDISSTNSLVLKEKEKHGAKTYHFWHLFATPKIRARVFITAFIWMVNSLTYFGLSLGIRNLAGDVYINTIIGASVEILPSLFMQFVAARFGHRHSLAVNHILCGIMCVILACLPKHGDTNMENTKIALNLIGRFFNAAAWCSFTIYQTELFPTVLRNNAIGFCAFIQRLGAVLAPLSEAIPRAGIVVLPTMIFGALSVISGGVAYILPETYGKPMPDLVEDVEHPMRRLSMKPDATELAFLVEKEEKASSSNLPKIIKVEKV